MPHAAHGTYTPTLCTQAPGRANVAKTGARTALPAEVGAIRRSSEEGRTACGSYFDLTSGKL